MMFKNQQDIDESIVGTINECRKYFDSGNLIKLFESNLFDDDFKTTNLVNIDNFYGNKIAYFNNVKTLFESTQEFKKSLLFESEGFTNFLTELEHEINNLINVDDVKKLSVVDNLVLQTKIFANTPINILGFNINDFNRILSTNNISNCFMVIYCKSNKTILFPTNNNIILYDIMTGKLELNGAKYIYESFNKNVFDSTTYSIPNSFTFENIFIFIETFYSKNYLVIESKQDENKIKAVSDNLFNDKSLQNGWKKRYQTVNKNSILR